MGDRGFLVPPWYISESPDDIQMNICSIIWGVSLCSALYTGSKASRLSSVAHRRHKLFSAFPIMVWAEWTSSVIISVVSWLFLKGIIPPSFELFFGILILWACQMHCILQIIINRVSLIMFDKALARKLKIVVFVVVLLINISVFCIWIPARLQISQAYIRINEVWDRMEKGIFAVVDASLNLFFMYTVKTKLVAAGMENYRTLFRFNSVMVVISLTLDILLIGSMSIGTGVIYIQVHPLVYLFKLHIELNMAELIAKIVSTMNPLGASVDANTAVTTTASVASPRTQNSQKAESSRRWSTQPASPQPSYPPVAHLEAEDQVVSLPIKPSSITQSVTRLDISRHKSNDDTLQEEDGSDTESLRRLRRQYSIL
ncbi:hypothetical protein BX600DRAFT_196956 [Xylariales sp. PMI_506]|nr:hypothetical protein BX600DRAFT_196956 [Xylariales sp. PMI_506]